MFTQKQKVLIVAIAVGIVIAFFAFMQLLIMMVSASEVPLPPSKTYQVVHQEEDGYYVAIQVVKTEDGAFVPRSFYEREDKMVVYLPENVTGEIPNIGDLIDVQMDRNGENPVVTMR